MSDMPSALQSYGQYPLRLEIDYPTEGRNRVTALFRWLLVIPIFIVFAAAAGGGGANFNNNRTTAVQTKAGTTTVTRPAGVDDGVLTFLEREDLAPGIPNAAVLGVVVFVAVVAFGPGFLVTFSGVFGSHLFIATALMILFREKYPRWWFEFTRELSRFAIRVVSYAALLRDEYPSTDEEQAVHLEIDPPAAGDLNRWMILVKWLLIIPHGLILFFLTPFVTLALYASWICVVILGRQPRFLFDFIVGTMRWSLRVGAYSAFLVTDEYPPFSFR